MVSLLLLCKNKKFLLVKRSPSEKNYSGYWGLPGGGVDDNETPTDALIREIREELGIELSNFKLLNRYDTDNTIINLYVHNSSGFNENNITLNDEHTGFGLFSYYQIHQMKNVIPTTFTFISDYLNNPNL